MKGLRFVSIFTTTLSWSLNGRVILEKRGDHSLPLKIRNIDNSSSGEYICRVETEHKVKRRGERIKTSGRAIGVNRALRTGGIKAMGFPEEALGRPAPLKVLVDAVVCMAAAEKGAWRQMKYLSKTQCLVLFWLRDAVRNAAP